MSTLRTISYLLLLLLPASPWAQTDLRALLQEGKQLWWSDHDSAITVFDTGAKLAQQAGDEAMQAAFLSELAIGLSRTDRHSEALATWRSITQKLRGSEMDMAQLSAMEGMANEHKILGNLDSALQFALDAIAFRGDHQLNPQRATETIVGEIYYELKKYTLAEDFFRKCLDYSEDGPATHRIIPRYYLAQIFIETAQVDSFLKYQSDLASASSHDGSQPSSAIYHLAYFFRDSTGTLDQGKINSMMSAAGDSHAYFLPMGHGLLAQMAIEKEEYALALRHADTAVAWEYDLQDKQRYLERRAHALAGLQRYNDAYNTMLEVQSLTNENLDNDTRKRIDALQVQFDTERKEKEILRQRAEIIETRSHRTQLWLALVSVFVMAGLIILFLRQRMAKKELLAKQEKFLHDQNVSRLEKEKKILAMSSMIEGQEAERSRVAQDLHDGLGALMATVKAHFQLIQSKVEHNGEARLFRKTDELIDHACEEVSRISRNMMPKALSDSGLASAIHDLAVTTGEAYEIQVETELQGMEDRLDETSEIMIFRVIQELVNNSAKHAKAQNLLLQCIRRDQQLFLLVEDDGRGFQQDTSRKGLGLEGIKSRVAFLNGDVEFDSRPDVGTSVSINIPLNA